VSTTDDDRLVTVCSACLCASCWQAVFFCQGFRVGSSKRMTVGELRALERESPSYWSPERLAKFGEGAS
jgi:hypothetical protein